MEEKTSKVHTSKGEGKVLGTIRKKRHLRESLLDGRYFKRCDEQTYMRSFFQVLSIFSSFAHFW